MSTPKAVSSRKWALTAKNDYTCECENHDRSKGKSLPSSVSDCECDSGCRHRKRLALDPSFTPKEMSSLGVCFLPDKVELERYNGHAAKRVNEFEESKKLQLDPVSDCTTYESSSRKAPDQDPFKSLPDEVVMIVLRFLRKRSLIRLSQTCRRFRRICRDETLWKRFNLAQRKLDTDDIGHVLTLGVRVLRLNTINFSRPMLTKAMTARLEGYVCNVRYLDLSYSSLEVEDLALLMSKMRHLIKLSLESAHVDLNVIAAIKENQNLDTLNLAMAVGLDVECITMLCQALTKLESLNLGWTKLDEPSLDALCNTVTPLIRHLDVSGAKWELLNESLISLIRRCPDLETLDLSDCVSLSVASFRILIENLPELKTLYVSRCRQIDKTVLLEVQHIPKLEVLSAYPNLPEAELQHFQCLLPNVRINQSPFSVVARPTVGIRRSSIWEKPTTD